MYKSKKEKLKKVIIEKIILFLNNKYGGIFKDKGYTQTMLNTDLNKLLTDNEIKNFQFAKDIQKYEKIILQKVSKLQNPKVIPLEMNQIEKLLPKHSDSLNQKEINNENKKNNRLINVKNNENDNLNKNNIPYSTEKIKQLKLKENDKFAVQAKKDYNNYLEEEKIQKLKLIEKQRQQKEALEMQIREKKEREKQLKEEDNKIYNGFNIGSENLNDKKVKLQKNKINYNNNDNNFINNNNSNNIEPKNNNLNLQYENTPFEQKIRDQRLYDEKKLMREMEEQRQKELEYERKEKEKKRKMLEEFRKGLDAQINEKKKNLNFINDEKNEDRLLNDKINQEILEKKENDKKNKINKINQYKNELDLQIKNKVNNNNN
jgi:hypothetical protein